MRRGTFGSVAFERPTRRPFHPSALDRAPLRSRLLQTVPQLCPLCQVSQSAAFSFGAMTSGSTRAEFTERSSRRGRKYLKSSRVPTVVSAAAAYSCTSSTSISLNGLDVSRSSSFSGCVAARFQEPLACDSERRLHSLDQEVVVASGWGASNSGACSCGFSPLASIALTGHCVSYRPTGLVISFPGNSRDMTLRLLPPPELRAQSPSEPWQNRT